MGMVLFTTVFLVALGAAAGLVLAIAARVFYVWEDPRIEAVEESLLGANCGACGFPGCAAAAEAVVRGKAGPDVCVAGGYEVARRVAEVMDATVAPMEPRKAVLACRYAVEDAELKYIYNGMNDCRAAVLLYGGAKECLTGCLGLGTCVRACPFDAIHIGQDGLPVVSDSLCTGCGLCAERCPTHALRLESLSERLLRFEGAEDCLAPCRLACPAQVDIPAYVRHIQSGRYLDAIAVIRERNPLPLTCGRVCPHPCEAECRRRLVDEAVAVNPLKRFAADYEVRSGERAMPPIAPDTGKRVAIIGGGPAGLSCAYFLRRLGHRPEVFESRPELGGMLRYGIPEYRLPKSVLDWEIEGIMALGVKAHTNQTLGKEVSIGRLREDGFDAIFVAIGAWKSASLGVEGEHLPGVVGGIAFLNRQNSGGPLPLGRRVAVIGGGNTAVDAARTCLRRGCAEVTLLYRRSRNEMPADAHEVAEAEREGVRLQFLCAPSRLIAGPEGNLAKMEFIRMDLGEPDESGRRRPVPIAGSEATMDVDNVIAAIGQQVDARFNADAPDEVRLGVTRWDTLEADPGTLRTRVPYVFVGGDVFTGPETVVGAIAAGRRAARAIHLHLTGREVVAPKADLVTPAREVAADLSDVPRVPRTAMPEAPVAERLQGFGDVELGLSETDARRESQRCLQCGRVCHLHATPLPQVR